MLIKLPSEIQYEIAQKAQLKRKALGLSQQGLAQKSGVSFGSIKRFETSGKISLESLLKIALVLDCLGDFESLFKSDDTPKSLNEILKGNKK